MSGLYESRWATTQPSEPQLKEKDTQETPIAPSSETVSPNTAEAHEPAVTSAALQVEGKTEAVSRMAVSVDGPLAMDKSPALDDVDHISDHWRPVPRRLRTKVSWRGKTCVISIPKEATGYLKPMSSEEIHDRLKKFEDAGYDTRGFQHGDENGSDQVHVKPIYPDEADLRREAGQQPPRVSMPNLAKWAVYMDELTERKLAALGVSAGSTDLSPLPGSQEMSRQNTLQHPPLPLSPPISVASPGSMGKPGMIRGHTNTMSVASPLSPGDGLFRHMHRHSTFTGPFPFDQRPVQQARASPIPGMHPFSPSQQFGFPGILRDGSPSHLANIHQDLSLGRGPGSPHGLQWTSQSPSDYSRDLMEDQRIRQHAYSQSVQINPSPSVPALPNGGALQTPAMPKLREEDEEGELKEKEGRLERKLEAPEPEVGQPEPPTYVPPHKRPQVNNEIANPTTRGHGHNISQDLERDLLAAEIRHEVQRSNWIEVDEEACDGDEVVTDTTRSAMPESTTKTKSLPADHSVHNAVRSHKKSASRFNVEAPAFTPSLRAVSQPVPTAFVFGGGLPQTNGQPPPSNNPSMSPNSSSATGVPPAKSVNAAFSFSTQGPSFKPNAAPFEPRRAPGRTVIDELPSIFGQIKLPDIVKPSRRSKAVAIVRPDERKPLESGTELDDEDGRVMQSDDRLKRQRKVDDDGDEVPQFAVPLPMPDPIDFVPRAVEKPNANSDHTPADAAHLVDKDDIAEEAVAEHDSRNAQPSTPKDSERSSPISSGSSSDKEKPLDPSYPQSHLQVESSEHCASRDGLEERNVVHHRDTFAKDSNGVSPQLAMPAPNLSSLGPRGELNNETARPAWSFDEIDAVMRQLNESEAPESERQEKDAMSPLPSLDGQTMDGVTYLPKWNRSDAPSPSPTRLKAQQIQLADSSFTVHDRTDSGEAPSDSRTQVYHLNKADDAPASDWSDMLSPPDQEKLVQRSNFFDSHIDEVIGRVVERRLLPLEQRLREIQHVVSKRPTSKDQFLVKRSSSVVDSDADDEDELSEAQQQRPSSCGRDKRLDQIKAVVLEALHEQNPKSSHSSIAMAEMRSSLEDMKLSFTRTASTTVVLDDVRAVVQDVLDKHRGAVPPTSNNEVTIHHKREVSELEGKLHETLAGALEEANHRRAVEERDAETRKMLRLAEEELSLTREAARDEQSRIRALERERNELLDRAHTAEEQLKGLEAENAAMQGTLEEYRMSSDKWRQAIDDGHRECKELENTIAVLERQAEDSHDSGNAMRRRLEKLHADMALAAGQFASEQSRWKAKEDEYRARYDELKKRDASDASEKAEMQGAIDRLRDVAIASAETNKDRDSERSENAALDELLRQLKADLADQHALNAHQASEARDARQEERAEAHRVRLSLESDVAAATRQVDGVRAELGGEVSKLRAELESASRQADMIQARYMRQLEDEKAASRETLLKSSQKHSDALDEARHRYEVHIEQLTLQHNRELRFAVEDKERSQLFFDERLALSEAKLQHSHDRSDHLQERLAVAMSAAQAAATKAKAFSTVAATPAPEVLPERSSQALRESILVLQEQLQEREVRLDRLREEIEKAGVAKSKERDDEIAWLRELLGVRSEELTDLVDTLSQPDIDRRALRDIAIRIRANLQMQQQEKERLDQLPSLLRVQTLPSLSAFATPKAAQLTNVFSKWRANMESSSLRTAPHSARARMSSTPSRTYSVPTPRQYSQGLMTPPTSSIRSTPSLQKPSTFPLPPLHSRDGPKPDRQVRSTTTSPTTPRFRQQSFDHDAQEHIDSTHDDDLDVADSTPPATRSFVAEPDALAGAEISADRI